MKSTGSSLDLTLLISIWQNFAEICTHTFKYLYFIQKLYKTKLHVQIKPAIVEIPRVSPIVKSMYSPLKNR